MGRHCWWRQQQQLLCIRFTGNEESFEKFMLLEENTQIWKTQLDILHGRCFSFTLPENIKELGIRKIIFEMRRTFLIYFHLHGQFYRTDSLRKSYEGVFGHHSPIDLSYDVSNFSDMKFLLYCFRIYVFSSEVSLSF